MSLTSLAAERRWSSRGTPSEEPIASASKVQTGALSFSNPPFESPDSINRHQFQVTAIDNEAAESIRPAEIVFWTPQATTPNTIFQAPFPPDSAFIRFDLTDTFRGLRFRFTGIDAGTEKFEYSWSTDSVTWSPFTLLTVFPGEAILTAANLAQPWTGTHRIWAKARNEFGVEDPTPALRTFTTVHALFLDPNFERRILVVGSMRDSGATFAGCPTNASIERFYRSVFDSAGLGNRYDMWNVRTQSWPSRSLLSRYSAVFFYSDYWNSALSLKISPAAAAIFVDYLNVGGKLIVSSWDFGSHFAANADTIILPRLFITSGLTPTIQDFVGAMGALDYPSVSLDTSKFPSGWENALSRITPVSPQGFAEVTLRYTSRTLDPRYHGRPIGVRFRGTATTYSTVFFGVPLYFVEHPTAVELLTKALRDIGE